MAPRGFPSLDHSLDRLTTPLLALSTELLRPTKPPLRRGASVGDILCHCSGAVLLTIHSRSTWANPVALIITHKCYQTPADHSVCCLAIPPGHLGERPLISKSLPIQRLPQAGGTDNAVLWNGAWSRIGWEETAIARLFQRAGEMFDSGKPSDPRSLFIKSSRDHRASMMVECFWLVCNVQKLLQKSRVGFRKSSFK